MEKWRSPLPPLSTTTAARCTRCSAQAQRRVRSARVAHAPRAPAHAALRAPSSWVVSVPSVRQRSAPLDPRRSPPALRAHAAVSVRRCAAAAARSPTSSSARLRVCCSTTARAAAAAALPPSASWPPVGLRARGGGASAASACAAACDRRAACNGGEQRTPPALAGLRAHPALSKDASPACGSRWSVGSTRRRGQQRSAGAWAAARTPGDAQHAPRCSVGSSTPMMPSSVAKSYTPCPAACRSASGGRYARADTRQLRPQRAPLRESFAAARRAATTRPRRP